MGLPLHNYLVVFGCFSPLFAVLFNHLPLLNCRKWFVISELSTISLATLIVMRFINTVQHTWMYFLFLALFNLVFTHRFGIKNFSKTLAVSLMLTYITTEMHEIPWFAFGYLGLFNQVLHPLHPLCHLYSFAVGCLVIKIANLKITKANALIFCLSIATLFYAFFRGTPHPIYTRGFCFLVLLVIFYFGSNLGTVKKHEQK